MPEMDRAAFGLTAYSLLQSLLLRLIGKGVMTNEEVRDLYQDVADRKAADERCGGSAWGVASLDGQASTLARRMALDMQDIIDEGGENSN
jgi:hypothetical protein